MGHRFATCDTQKKSNNLNYPLAGTLELAAMEPPAHDIMEQRYHGEIGRILCDGWNSLLAADCASAARVQPARARSHSLPHLPSHAFRLIDNAMRTAITESKGLNKI